MPIAVRESPEKIFTPRVLREYLFWVCGGTNVGPNGPRFDHHVPHLAPWARPVGTISRRRWVFALWENFLKIIRLRRDGVDREMHKLIQNRTF